MAQKIVNVTLIPTGGQEADRVSFPASDILLNGITDKKNNILKKGEKTYKLDSLLWDIEDIIPVP